MDSYVDDCAIFREEIELGRIDDFSESLRRHLQYCLQCQQNLRALSQMDDIIRAGMHNVEVPMGLRERVMSKLVSPGVEAVNLELMPGLRPKP